MYQVSKGITLEWFHFLPQRHYLVKAFVAVWTLVALLHVMNLQMSHLGSRIRERFLTVVTVIGLLATMHQLVAFQIA